MIKVSIIVPVYNVEKYLSRCLDSLLHQTVDSYEIICVNDCSPDGSEDILKRYAEDFPGKIRVLRNERNMGLGLSRNKGIEAAQGEYLMFVDSDDYVKPNYVETYLNEMLKEPVDILVGGYIRQIGSKCHEHVLSQTVWSTVTYAIACAKMFRKQFFEEHNLRFIDIKSGEDIYFSLSAFYYGATFRVIKYAGYYYVFNEASITGSMNYEKNYEQIMIALFSRFCEEHDLSVIPQDKYRVIEYVYLANMINALIVFAHGCGVQRMKKKWELVFRDLENRFPDYRKNPYVGILKPKGQTIKIRLGVGGVYYLSKLHLDRQFFLLVSLIK